jgi:pilus assembly protein CpaE
MSDPMVIIPSDLAPELAQNVSSALQGLGVAAVRQLPPPSVNGTAPHKVIVVLSPKGGSGKTAVASNLAVKLSQQHPGQVVAVDLDVQFGDLSVVLGLQPAHDLAQLARTSSLDATTVKVFLTAYEDMYVLAGAANPVEADVITHEHISTVLPLLAQSFTYVVVDTPAGLDERTLAAIECATDLLVISSLDVTSIRSLRKALDTLDRIGVTAERKFVLNRADAKVGLSHGDAEAAVGLKLACTIPSSRDVPLSLNLGRPVVESEPKSAVAKQLSLLAQQYAPSGVDKPRKGWRR